MSVDIDVVKRRVAIHRPKVVDLYEASDPGLSTVFVNLEADGVQITLYLDAAAFRDLMTAGRELATRRAARIRVQLETVEALAADEGCGTETGSP